jgi:hypothetical protein
MLKVMTALVTSIVALLTVVIILGALGLDPWKGPRKLFSTEKEITKKSVEEKREVRKITADTNSMQCFSHQVWHAAWLNGVGDKTTALLVAVATRNLVERKSGPTDYCTIFTTGKAELPDKRTSTTEKSYIWREVEVVSGQSSTSARTAQYGDAEKIAEKVAATETYRALLPSELSHARCVEKFLRKKFGWLIWTTVGARHNVRAAFVAQYGDPVYTAPDGTEFFGKCPA